MKKIILLMLFAICVFSSAYVMANDSVDNAVINGNTLTITGTIPDDASSYVTLEVLKDNVCYTQEEKTGTITKSLDEFDIHTDDISDYLEYFTQLTKGDYTLTINGTTLQNAPEIRIRLGEDRYYFYSPRTVKALKDAKANNDYLSLKSIMLSNSYLNSEISSSLSDISDSEETAFWQMYTEIGNFSTLSEIADTFDDYVVLFKIKSSTLDTLDDNISLLLNYGLGDDNSYDLYIGQGKFISGELSTEQKAELKAYLLSKLADYTLIEEFIDDFNEKTVLYAIYNGKTKHTVNSVISKSTVIKKAGISDYLKLKETSDKLSVCTNISKTFYQSLSSLTTQINTLSRKIANSKDDTPSSSQGSASPGKVVGETTNDTSDDIKDDNINNETFTDLDNHIWAKEAIYFLKGKNVINGRTSEIFAPSDYVTREEFSKIIVLALSKYNPNAKADFNDIKSTDWEYSYVASAKEANLIKGIDDNTFGKGNPITRQDMAVIITRAIMGSDAQSVSSTTFNDDNMISLYAKASCEYVKTMGIMTGVGDNTFSPKTYVTRAEASKAIYELIKKG